MQRLPHTSVALFWGLSLGQLGVLVAWLALARHRFLFRLTTTLAVAALLGQTMAASSRIDFAQWFCFNGLFVCCTGSMLFVLRMSGMRFVDETSTGPLLRARNPGPWQFSTGSLLARMTAVAFILGVVKWMEFPRPFVMEVTLYCVGFSGVTFVTLWLVLVCDRPRGWTIGLCVAVAGSIGIFFGFGVFVVTTCTTQFAVTCAVGLALRGGDIDGEKSGAELELFGAC